MHATELFELRGQLRQAGIIIAYCGYVTEPVLTGVGDALKQKLGLEDMDTKTARSVFAVFVEQMQNIIRYSAEKDEHAQRSDGASASPSATDRPVPACPPSNTSCSDSLRRGKPPTPSSWRSVSKRPRRPVSSLCG